MIRLSDCRLDSNFSGSGELLISVRDRIPHYDLDIFVECSQQPVET
jgi:hypothetical protein